MIIKNVVTHNRNNADDILDFAVLVERLKRLRALNREPDKIGITQYKWRSFTIDKGRAR